MSVTLVFGLPGWCG